MTDADMQIVDDYPADPLDFSLIRYYDQLVAGYTKNTPNAAMVSFVPDFNRLARPLAPPGTQPAPGSSGPPPAPGREIRRALSPV
jgi:hypothetical protein